MMALKDDEVEIPLLPDILQNSILSYVDLHSLIRFSGCSRKCRKIVFDDAPAERWREVQFCDGKRPCHINDHQLRAFLRKANAKEHTRKLSLIGCPNLNGRGLAPLTGSQVLEDVDLRVVGTLPLKGEQGEQYGPTCLDELRIYSIMMSVLSDLRHLWHSCSGSGVMLLRRIAIRTETLPVGMSTQLRLIYDRRERFRSRWSPPSCSQCKALRSNDWLKISDHFCGAPNCRRSSTWCPACKEHDDATPYTKCLGCRSDYCKQCTPQMIKCAVCKHNYCKACAMPPTCPECTIPKCQWCSTITKCNGCNKECCASHGFESCGNCDKNFCVDCTDDELLFCVVCNQHYCGAECHKSVHG